MDISIFEAELTEHLVDTISQPCLRDYKTAFRNLQSSLALPAIMSAEILSFHEQRRFIAFSFDCQPYSFEPTNLTERTRWHRPEYKSVFFSSNDRFACTAFITAEPSVRLEINVYDCHSDAHNTFTFDIPPVTFIRSITICADRCIVLYDSQEDESEEKDSCDMKYVDLLTGKEELSVRITPLVGFLPSIRDGSLVVDVVSMTVADRPMVLVQVPGLIGLPYDVETGNCTAVWVMNDKEERINLRACHMLVSYHDTEDDTITSVQVYAKGVEACLDLCGDEDRMRCLKHVPLKTDFSMNSRILMQWEDYFAFGVVQRRHSSGKKIFVLFSKDNAKLNCNYAWFEVPNPSIHIPLLEGDVRKFNTRCGNPTKQGGHFLSSVDGEMTLDRFIGKHDRSGRYYFSSDRGVVKVEFERDDGELVGEVEIVEPDWFSRFWAMM